MIGLTAKERAFIQRVFDDWLSEGFTTPPYPSEFYSVIDKLGVQTAHETAHDHPQKPS